MLRQRLQRLGGSLALSRTKKESRQLKSALSRNISKSAYSTASILVAAISCLPLSPLCIVPVTFTFLLSLQICSWKFLATSLFSRRTVLVLPFLPETSTAVWHLSVWCKAHLAHFARTRDGLFFAGVFCGEACRSQAENGNGGNSCDQCFNHFHICSIGIFDRQCAALFSQTQQRRFCNREKPDSALDVWQALSSFRPPNRGPFRLIAPLLPLRKYPALPPL